MKRIVLVLLFASFVFGMSCTARILSSRDHLSQGEMEREYKTDLILLKKAAIRSLEELDLMVLGYNPETCELTARSAEFADKFLESDRSDVIVIDDDNNRAFNINLGSDGNTKTLRYYSKVYCRLEELAPGRTRIVLFATPVINGREDMEKIIDEPDYIKNIKHLVDGRREADLVRAVLFKLDQRVNDNL